MIFNFISVNGFQSFDISLFNPIQSELGEYFPIESIWTYVVSFWMLLDTSFKSEPIRIYFFVEEEVPDGKKVQFVRVFWSILFTPDYAQFY